MNLVVLSVLSLLSLENPKINDDSGTRTYQGEAFDLNKMIPIYVEEHEESYSQGKKTFLSTTYKDTLNRVIANRSVDFSKNYFAPDFSMEDLRTGYLEGAEQVKEGIRLFWRETSEDPIEDKIIDIPMPAVVDAGFNNFVQTNWDSIMNGNTLQMNFAIPFKLDYYSFRLYKESERVINGRNVVEVICDIDNFFIRLFVNPIILLYDTETRRLVSYNGISNINDENGRSHFARINYNPYGP